ADLPIRNQRDNYDLNPLRPSRRHGMRTRVPTHALPPAALTRPAASGYARRRVLPEPNPPHPDRVRAADGGGMRIGVIGAGIGGLTAAAALCADGHRVTVYEERDEPGAVGAGLTLFDNAFGALDAVGAGHAVRAVSSDVLASTRGGQRSPAGDWLVSIPPAHAPAVH